ncbi:MAG TPA: peptidase, partial [Gammaproteobacteria bacterium]|nr:peptidase [Gammaproteobacteria bacterium]
SLTTAVGFSVPANTALPWLELNRLFVLTTSATCSASESLINGLRGIDIPVYQFGSNTCGKPYGFYPQNNCGTTYFTIQFKGINAKGFGDYSEGFAPISDTDNTLSSDQLPGCTVGENYSPLGSGSESLLQSALAYRLNEGGCPASSSLATVTPTTKSRPVSSDQVIARPQRPGRILLREQP